MNPYCPGVAGGGQVNSHWANLSQEPPTCHHHHPPPQQPQTLTGLSVSGRGWLFTAGKLSALRTADGAQQKSWGVREEPGFVQRREEMTFFSSSILLMNRKQLGGVGRWEVSPCTAAQALCSPIMPSSLTFFPWACHSSPVT